MIDEEKIEAEETAHKEEVVEENIPKLPSITDGYKGEKKKETAE